MMFHNILKPHCLYDVLGTRLLQQYMVLLLLLIATSTIVVNPESRVLLITIRGKSKDFNN